MNEHPLDVLALGVEAWNQWRSQHPEILPDLSGASLADLYLRRVNLVSANLSDAILTRADLTEANLRDAILTNANLSDAILTRADLTEANLRDAILTNANLSSANLSNADLSQAQIGFTLFVNNELQSVKGLDTVHHTKPSSIGIDTLYRSDGQIPASFLREAGVPEDFITYMYSLLASRIEYYTCFLCYSSKDQDFAERLYADLQAKGVRCWFASEDMKIGDKIRQRIDESIRLYDKLVLVLSEHSVDSAWVEYEVNSALRKERQVQRTVLFPLRLDNSITLSNTPWAANIRLTRHIASFELWKDHDKYQVALSRLVRDLKADVVSEANRGASKNEK